MIEVGNLTRVFGGTVAVNDVSFTVERGEIVGFLGPNGAGKTTTMRVLTGYLPPSLGSARVAGFDVVSQSLDVRRRVGYLPESNPLYVEMRVEDYLLFRAGIKHVARRDRRKFVEEVIDRCGLSERRRQVIGRLSKGYKQRVGLADALAHKPELIILDEPTQGLDPNQVREVRTLIRDLGEKQTILLSTHILSEVEKVCSRVLIIHRGRLIRQGSPTEIAGRITRTGRIRMEVQGDGPAIGESIRKMEGVAAVQVDSRSGVHTFIVEPVEGRDLRSSLFRLAQEEGWALSELAYDRVSLEDAFVELTLAGEEKHG